MPQTVKLRDAEFALNSEIRRIHGCSSAAEGKVRRPGSFITLSAIMWSRPAANTAARAATTALKYHTAEWIRPCEDALWTDCCGEGSDPLHPLHPLNPLCCCAESDGLCVFSCEMQELPLAPSLSGRPPLATTSLGVQELDPAPTELKCLPGWRAALHRHQERPDERVLSTYSSWREKKNGPSCEGPFYASGGIQL
jgi:hypothetical protein